MEDYCFRVASIDGGARYEATRLYSLADALDIGSDMTVPVARGETPWDAIANLCRELSKDEQFPL